MNFFELARRWTILLLAQVLRTSTTAIEAVLPFQPQWLAQVRLLETELRASATRRRPPLAPAGLDAVQEDDPGPDLDALLASYTILQRTVMDLEARGLSLDEGLLNRMKAEWNAESIVSYLKSSESQLRRTVSDALAQAAAPLAAGAGGLGPSGNAMTEAPARTPARPVAARPRATARCGAGRKAGHPR